MHLTTHDYSYCTANCLTSFPGRSHNQYLIACSMQIRRGKTSKIWSRAGRHIVNTWGAVITPVLHLSIPGVVKKRMVLVICLANALTSSLWTDSTKDIEIICWALPPVCLPSVYLMAVHLTRSPRPSPQYLHAASDQILAVRMT